jgi:hypothetical protein
MGQDFQFDVFLSHSAKDKAVVRLAEPLPKGSILPRFGLHGRKESERLQAPH